MTHVRILATIAGLTLLASACGTSADLRSSSPTSDQVVLPTTVEPSPSDSDGATNDTDAADRSAGDASIDISGGGVRVEADGDSAGIDVTADTDDPVTAGVDATGADAGVYLVGTGLVKTADCAGGGAAITGTDNTFTLSGTCAAVLVLGSGNTVTIDTAAAVVIEGIENDVTIASVGEITVAGSDNDVVWTTGVDGEPPTVTDMTGMNTIEEG